MSISAPETLADGFKGPAPRKDGGLRLHHAFCPKTQLQCYMCVRLFNCPSCHDLLQSDWLLIPAPELRFTSADLTNLPLAAGGVLLCSFLLFWTVQPSPSWNVCMLTSKQKVIDGATGKPVHIGRDASSCLLARRRN